MSINIRLPLAIRLAVMILLIPVIAMFVPETARAQEPLIAVDERGFLHSAKKVFYIEEPVKNKEFVIFDTVNKKIVFTGRLQEVEAGSELKQGDFSSLTDKGTYRVYQSEVGFSSEFVIDDELYHKLYNDIYTDLMLSGDMEETDELEFLCYLMAVKEIYPDAYMNDKALKDRITSLYDKKVPEWLEMLSVRQDVEDTAVIEEINKTAVFTGLLSEASVVFGDDELFVNEYRRTARLLYQYISSYSKVMDRDALYYSLTELYKATGIYTYRRAVGIMKEEEMAKAVADGGTAVDVENAITGGGVVAGDASASEANVSAGSDTEEHHGSAPSKEPTGYGDYRFLGDIAYLTTSFKTDYNQCEAILKEYVDKAADMSNRSDKAHYYVQNDVKDLTIEEYIDNTVILGLVSYILTAHEYASVRDNYIHYMMGLNSDRTDYYTEYLTGNGSEDINKTVCYVKMLFTLAGNS
jgi:hypothetical protein